MSCTYRNSVLESAEFYSTFLHGLSVFQIPLHVLGTYIVLTKTPTVMGSIKFSMLFLHLTSAWSDICLTILAIPYVFMPVFSGQALGLLSFFGVPVWFQIYIAFTSVYLIGTAQILFFEDRYNCIVRQNASEESMRIKRFIHHSINIIIAFTFVIPSLLNIPDTQKARRLYQERIPCVPSKIVQDKKMFMLTDNYMTFIPLFLLEILNISIQCAFFVIQTSFHLLKTKSLFLITLNLQKQLFKSLCIQAAIPLLAIVGPGLYIIYSMVTYSLDMALTNLALICISTHGLLSTGTMLFVHKPYRRATLDIFKRRKLEHTDSTLFLRIRNNSA